MYMRESGFTFGNDKRVSFFKRLRYLMFGDIRDMMGDSKTVVPEDRWTRKKK